MHRYGRRMGRDAVPEGGWKEPGAVTQQIVMQRVRNRIIEYLQTASSFKEQEDYQRSVPHVHVPHEVIEQWADQVSDPEDAFFRSPVFSDDERRAMSVFHRVWDDVCEHTPNPLPALDQLFVDPWVSGWSETAVARVI